MVSIASLLKGLGDTQEEQAKALGVERSLLSHVKRGTRPVSRKMAAKICAKTGASVSIKGDGTLHFTKKTRKK